MPDEQLDTPPTPTGLWDWLEEDAPGESREVPDPTGVTAVMVVHNAAEWLPRQLLALARLDPRPGRIVAVDNGSTDDSRDLLERARAEGVLDALVAGDAGDGYGQAVRRGLDDTEPSWVWLLHDDSAPQPDALGELLAGAAETSAAMVLPKLLQPRRRNYPWTLAEAGQTITRTGSRVLDVDEGDIDQHQLTAREVLGGSTAGMLVRGEVWRELGGLAPQVPLHRDGVDLGWRAWLAGHSVTTWPRAAVVHRQAGRTSERQPALARTTHELDRYAALQVAAARPASPPSRAVLVLWGWLRALGYLLGKSPRTALAELRATRRFQAARDETAALRSLAHPGEDPPHVLPGPRWGTRHVLDRIGNGIAERYRDLTSSDPETSLDELTGDDFAGSGATRTRWVSPVLALLAILLLVGAVAGRTLYGSGVAGGWLMPAPASLDEAWGSALEPVAGVPGAPAPWLTLAAAASTAALGSPALLALLLVLGAPVVAALAAVRALRDWGASSWRAAAGGLGWAGAAVVLGLVTAGDVSGMVLAMVIPLAARAARRVLLDDSSGAEALRAPAALGFWILLASVVWPAALALATVAALSLAVARRMRPLSAAIAVGIPWLAMLPWLPTLWRWPGRALTGVDPLAAPAWPPPDHALLVGRILPSGLPLWASIACTIILAATVLLALSAVPPRRGWGTLLVCGVLMVVAAGLSRLAVDVNGGEARALLSGWVLLAVAGVLSIVLAEDRSAPRLDALRLVAVAAAGAVGIGSWAWVGFTSAVEPTTTVLPGYVVDVMDSTRQTRTLLIEREGDSGVAWNVADHRHPTWGSAEQPLPAAFADEFSGVVQAMSGGSVPEDLARQLESLAVGHVLMSGFDADQLAAVSNARGLTRAAVDEGSVVFTVTGLPSRTQLVAAEGRVPVADGELASEPDARHVVLSEEPDPRWWMAVGGRALEPAPDRPPVTFDLPAGSGGEVTHGMSRAWGALAWYAALVLVLAALAAPTLRSGGTVARRGI